MTHFGTCEAPEPAPKIRRLFIYYHARLGPAASGMSHGLGRPNISFSGADLGYAFSEAIG